MTPKQKLKLAADLEMLAKALRAEARAALKKRAPKKAARKAAKKVSPSKAKSSKKADTLKPFKFAKTSKYKLGAKGSAMVKRAKSGQARGMRR